MVLPRKINTSRARLLAIPFVRKGIGIALLMTHFSASISGLYRADLRAAIAACRDAPCPSRYEPSG